MATIKNIEGYTTEQLRQAVAQGGKFVFFSYTISIAVMTFKRASSITFIPPGEGTFKHRAGYSAVNLIMGWWGIPWGPIYTIGAMGTNMSGGKDVTAEVVSQLGLNAHQGYNVPGSNPPNQGNSGYNVPGSNPSTPPQQGNSGYNIPGTNAPSQGNNSGYNIPGTNSNSGQSSNNNPTYNIPR